jgi:hypothetical protein
MLAACHWSAALPWTGGTYFTGLDDGVIARSIFKSGASR